MDAAHSCFIELNWQSTHLEFLMDTVLHTKFYALSLCCSCQVEEIGPKKADTGRKKNETPSPQRWKFGQLSGAHQGKVSVAFHFVR